MGMLNLRRRWPGIHLELVPVFIADAGDIAALWGARRIPLAASGALLARGCLVLVGGDNKLVIVSQVRAHRSHLEPPSGIRLVGQWRASATPFRGHYPAPRLYRQV